MAIDFYGPNLKVKRAEHHIGSLETMFGQHIDDNVKRFRSQSQNAFQQIIFPEHTPTVLGDALHNLHAALDHAYHIVAEANKALPNNYRKFPFCKDMLTLKRSLDGHKKDGIAPNEKVCTAILDNIQPYE